MPSPIILVYNSNLLASCPAPELIFCIANSELFVLALVSFLHSALIGNTTRFNGDLAGIENIAAWELLFPLPEGVYHFV